MRISEDTWWYTCDMLWSCHANALRTCRDPQQFGLPSWEKDEKTSSLLKRILTFNCYRLLQFQLSTDYSDYSLFTSHGSLSESSQVNSMGLRMCTSEALRWANFAFVADGESSKSPKGEPLLRNWNIWWTFGRFRNNFFKVSENTEIVRLYKLSKLHKTAMIYEYNVLTLRCIETYRNYGLHFFSPSFQCCARTGSPQSGIPQLSGSVPGSLKLQRMSSQPCCAAAWSHPQSLPCKKTERNALQNGRTAIEQSYGSYWIYNSTWPYKVEACICTHICAQNYTNKAKISNIFHQNKAKISNIFHKVSLLCSLCASLWNVPSCCSCMIMMESIALALPLSRKALWRNSSLQQNEGRENSWTLTYSHWLSQLFISVHRNFRPALHLKSFESFINHL